jgi:membrane-associated phospholipid phosphatase
MLIASGIAACVYAITLLIMMGLGVSVQLPWSLILALGIIPLPFAYCIVLGGNYLQDRFKNKRGCIKLIGILSGTLLIFFYTINSPVIIVSGASSLIFILYLKIKRHINITTSMIGSFIFIVALFGVLSHLNYFALKQVINILRDVSLSKLDIVIYSFLFGEPVAYKGLFPLMKSSLIFRVFENAYSMLFLGIFVIAFQIECRIGNARCRYYGTLLICYLSGIFIFLVFPAVGPCIYFPNSFSDDYHGSMTHFVMQAFLSGYESIRQNSQEQTGVGYFVAFPSLHVAVAVVLQYFSRNSPFHFWMMLPINIALIASTVFLGYHYIVDVPGGVLLAFVAIGLMEKISEILNVGLNLMWRWARGI